MMRIGSLGFVGGLLLSSISNAQSPTPANDAEYIKLVMSAAPDEIVRDATIVRMEPNGDIGTLKKGTTEFTCFVGNNVPMCSDPNAMEWAKAWQTHAPPPEGGLYLYAQRRQRCQQYRSMGYQTRVGQSLDQDRLSRDGCRPACQNDDRISQDRRSRPDKAL